MRVIRHRRRHSHKSIFISFFGAGCSIAGLLLMTNPQFRVPGSGFCVTGLATIFMGSTHGFIDTTPKGRLFFRLGAILYLVGFALLVLGVFASD